MNAADFSAHLEATHSRLQQITGSKGAEYAHDADQLANFKRIGERLGQPPEAVALVYLTKHLDAIEAHIREPEKPLSEPISGRIDDALLYLVLLQAILYENSCGVRDPDRGIEARSGANGKHRSSTAAG